MIPSAHEYRRHPGRCGSLAHWKQRTMPRLTGLREIHADDDPNPDAPERYFKLTHPLTHVADVQLDPRLRFTALSPAADAGAIAEVINASYPAIRVTVGEVQSWGSRPVHGRANQASATP